MNATADFSSRSEIAKMIASANKEKERIYNQMIIADSLKRSDRKEWKLRYEALTATVRGLEYLSVQILVTSGRTPLI